MTATLPPQPLDERREQIRSRLAGASHVLCCLDFDGTLAPIVEDPDAATPIPAATSALEDLVAAPAVSTAIVSGRALSDVRTRIDGPSVYAGNHGLELHRDGSVAVHPVARKRAAQIDRVCHTLETVLDSVPNARVENKRLTGTVHLRSVPSAGHPVVERQTSAVVDALGAESLEISPGRKILEIGPSIPWGKGNAVALLDAEMPPETVPLYIGDDVTDESAFRAVEPEGIGIRVGEATPSAASTHVDSPDEVASFLEWLGSSALEELDRPARGPNVPSQSTRSAPPTVASRFE